MTPVHRLAITRIRRRQVPKAPCCCRLPISSKNCSDSIRSNHAGETALSFAALFGRMDTMAAIAARCADLDHADARGILRWQ
jgi:hypothetical protein